MHTHMNRASMPSVTHCKETRGWMLSTWQTAEGYGKERTIAERTQTEAHGQMGECLPGLTVFVPVEN